MQIVVKLRDIVIDPRKSVDLAARSPEEAEAAIRGA